MTDRDRSLETAIQALRETLRELRYGTVTIVVHDGEIVTIERTEKVRLQKPSGR